jgi:hypothetical protein
MLDWEAVKSATDDLLSAALLGIDWEAALQKIAESADAGGASLVRIRRGRLSAHLSSIDWAEAEADHLAGRAPASSLKYYPRHVYRSGFVVDHDVAAPSSR